jgi:hypothetical protein
MGQAEHGRVSHPPELLDHGGVDGRMAVPVDVAPERRDAVDVGVALGVVEVRPVGMFDDHGRLLVLPGLLLSEGMPNGAPIRLDEGRRAAHERQISHRLGRNRRVTA